MTATKQLTQAQRDARTERAMRQDKTEVGLYALVDFLIDSGAPEADVKRARLEANLFRLMERASAIGPGVSERIEFGGIDRLMVCQYAHGYRAWISWRVTQYTGFRASFAVDRNADPKKTYTRAKRAAKEAYTDLALNEDYAHSPRATEEFRAKHQDYADRARRVLDILETSTVEVKS